MKVAKRITKARNLLQANAWSDTKIKTNMTDMGNVMRKKY